MTKQAQIVGDIQRRIAQGDYAVGQVLPSQMALSEQYGVAVGTVRHALGQLVSQGILQSRRGAGTMVNPEAARLVDSRASSQIGILAPSHHERIFSGMFQPMVECMFSQGIATDISLIMSQGQTRESILQWAAPLQGIVVRGAVSMDLVEHLKATGKPVIVMGELWSDRCPAWASQITVDIELTMSTLLSYAQAMNHRRIVLVRGEGSYYYQRVGAAFEHEVEQYSLAAHCHQVVCPTQPPEEALIKYLAQTPVKPTLAIVEGGVQAGHCMYHLMRHGWRVPEQLSLLSITGQLPSDLFTDHLSRVEIPSQLYTRRLAQIMRDVIESGQVVRERIAPRLVVGQTCRPLEPAEAEE